jgi:hypothetical protein
MESNAHMSSTDTGFNYVIKIPKDDEDVSTTADLVAKNADNLESVQSRKSHAVLAYQMAIIYNKKCNHRRVET